MAIGNVELMQRCCPQHSCMVTAIIEKKKAGGRRQADKSEHRKAKLAETISPKGLAKNLSLPNPASPLVKKACSGLFT